MQKRRIHKKQRGFTLAELLVAIVIIGILFAITLPSLTNLTGQSKLDGAANAVHSASKLARQYALAHNQPTYLVFHDAQSTTNDNLAYRSYAVFTINIHTNPINQSAGYYLSDWETLPAGVVFDPTINISSNLFDVSSQGWQGGLNKNNELRIKSNSFIVYGFKPSGEAAAATHHIHLAEGIINNGQPVITSKQGKQIQFETIGRSKIMDYIYQENGTFKGLGNE